MVPSYLDMMEFSWRTIGVPIEGDTLRDYILEMAEHWYTYPLRLFETVPQDKYAVVRYDDLEDDPEAVITAIYQRFGYDMSPAYADLLHRQAEKARKFRSRHDYSLQGVGLTREQIRDRFSEVFERFAFPPAETVDSGTGDVAWQESTEATGEAEAGLPLGLGSGGAGA
jgi:hypothetical protein